MNKKFKNITYKGLLICAVWFVIALMISSITILNQIQSEYSQTISVIGAITFELFCITPWAISTPLIIWVAQNYRLVKNNIFTSLFMHLITALLVFVFHCIVQSYGVTIYFNHFFSWNYLTIDFMNFLDMRLMFYAGVVLTGYAIDYQQKIRESALREPRLKARLNKARYRAFLNQIQPRFLFSSIEAIQEKVGKNPNESEDILTDFSDLLRIMLQNTNKETLTIREDLESYYLYINLVEKRLGDTIEIKTNICKGCHEVFVPPFLILIPLFEEVVFSDERGPAAIKSISYNAIRNDDTLHLEIAIGGIDKYSEPRKKDHCQTLISDIRQRLQKIYTEPVTLKASERAKTMYVELCIPFKKKQPAISDEVRTGDFVFNH